METNGLTPESEIFTTEDTVSRGRMKRILTATAREKQHP
jgi:hypothetical protein